VCRGGGVLLAFLIGCVCVAGTSCVGVSVAVRWLQVLGGGRVVVVGAAAVAVAVAVVVGVCGAAAVG